VRGKTFQDCNADVSQPGAVKWLWNPIIGRKIRKLFAQAQMARIHDVSYD
jgi:hypothetical protein